MLQTTLCSVEKKLKQASVINDIRINKLIENMEYWHVESIITPSRIKSLLHITYKETYQVLDVIKDMGILRYNFQVYCSECKKFIDRPILQSLAQFPEEDYCEHGHRLSATRDTVLVYRVIKDE